MISIFLIQKYSKHVGLLWWIPRTASVEITFQVGSKEWRSATGVRPYQTYQQDQGAREPALEALVVAKCLADVALQPRSAGQFSHVRENCNWGFTPGIVSGENQPNDK